MAALLTSVTATPALAQKGKPGSSQPASAVVAVLDFDAAWHNQTAGLGQHTIVPPACTTSSHTAGPNEVALVSMNAYASPAGGSNDMLMLGVATSLDAGNTFTLVESTSTLDGMADGAAQVAMTKKIALVEGATYQFGAAFRTAAPLVIGYATCQGTVTIVRPLF
jgi:hypothetical protein